MFEGREEEGVKKKKGTVDSTRPRGIRVRKMKETKMKSWSRSVSERRLSKDEGERRKEEGERGGRRRFR